MGLAVIRESFRKGISGAVGGEYLKIGIQQVQVFVVHRGIGVKGFLKIGHTDVDHGDTGNISHALVNCNVAGGSGVGILLKFPFGDPETTFFVHGLIHGIPVKVGAVFDAEKSVRGGKIILISIQIQVDGGNKVVGLGHTSHHGTDAI